MIRRTPVGTCSSEAECFPGVILEQVGELTLSRDLTPLFITNSAKVCYSGIIPLWGPRSSINQPPGEQTKTTRLQELFWIPTLLSSILIQLKDTLEAAFTSISQSFGWHHEVEYPSVTTTIPTRAYLVAEASCPLFPERDASTTAVPADCRSGSRHVDRECQWRKSDIGRGAGVGECRIFWKRHTEPYAIRGFNRGCKSGYVSLWVTSTLV